MVTFQQSSLTEREAFIAIGLAVITSNPSLPAQIYDQGITLSPAPGVIATNTFNQPSQSTTTFPAVEHLASGAGFDWFESFHVVPRAFDFGNLLSAQSSPIQVFNAFRRQPKEWTSLINNAGVGTTIGGLPTLPTTIDALYGIAMTVDVGTSGDPFVDATIDFGFIGLPTIFVPIEIQRIVLWGAIPESEFTETVESVTNVYESKDGTEKRESVRLFPRQAWAYKYLIDEGTDMQALENLLFDFHQRTFGVPVWIEETVLTAAVSIGDLAINVESTAFRDFRVGGQAIIFTSQSSFDVLTIATGGITATSLTFDSGSVAAYSVGTRVYPLATCFAQPVIGGARWPVNLQQEKILFKSTSNGVDLSDLTAFSSFENKLLLDNGNVIGGTTTAHSFFMKIIELENKTGEPSQASPWDRHRRIHQFTLRADGLQAIWEMRQMLHAIRGRLTSFFVPRDSDDLQAVANLVIGLNSIDVTNVGYAQFVRNRQPKNVIRINFIDGSQPLMRRVVGSTTISTTVDQLFVDVNWPSTITPAEISRIEYVEKVRFDSDKIAIKHDKSSRRARMSAKVKAVLE